VYSLLAAKHLGWRMRATETDPANYQLAAENIRTNQLSESISLVQVAATEIFTETMLSSGEEEGDLVYDFSMCNPPFFAHDKLTDEERRRLKKTKDNAKRFKKKPRFCCCVSRIYVYRCVASLTIPIYCRFVNGIKKSAKYYEGNLRCTELPESLKFW
jgi:23S rRNA A1618 N6-methylase RlmF